MYAGRPKKVKKKKLRKTDERGRGGAKMQTVQMKCSHCGGTLFLERDKRFTMLSCPYCRSTMKMFTESDRVRIAEIQADTDRFGMALSYMKHRNRLTLEWVTQNARYLLYGIVAVFVIIMIVSNSIRNKDRIKVPFSSNDLNNKTFYDARTMLQDAGFSDIEVIARKDLWDGFLHNDQGNIGKVAQVSIDGDERFRENDSYNKTAKIRIWYHTYP